jgi:SynChlorMet cassette protein ScmD
MADKKPIANPSVVLREEFDDWAVLFDPDTGDGFALDPVGVYIWKRLDGKHSTEDIVAELRRDCEDVPTEAGEHCGKFVEELLSRGLAGFELAQPQTGPTAK